MRKLYYVISTLAFIIGLNLQSNAEVYTIQPIGHVVKNAGKVKIEILHQYKDALLVLDEFSHVFVFSGLGRTYQPGQKPLIEKRKHCLGNLPMWSCLDKFEYLHFLPITMQAVQVRNEKASPTSKCIGGLL